MRVLLRLAAAMVGELRERHKISDTDDAAPLGLPLVGGWLRWQTRVNAFFLGLTDEYPPFRLSS